MAAAI
jgi:hypothetical protein